MPKWISAGRFQKRQYSTYEEYAKHQAAKLQTLDLSKYEKQFHQVLTERLANVSTQLPGKSVLCLGARTGVECRAFIGLGAFAVGIDLNPGIDNRHVLPGDFHNIQFANESVDIVFTNALDHAFDLRRVLGELRRVLKSNGMFIAEIVDPAVRGPGEYESLWWDDLDTVAHTIEESGFTISRQQPFMVPWQGLHYIFIR